MANTALSVANLNFTDIKDSLKTYLQTQSALKDYDFSGSNLDVMLDVLAYNTYLNNFYLNMVANESFINSAVLRDSIVAHAKTLNYLPQSRSSSKAVIKLNITEIIKTLLYQSIHLSTSINQHIYSQQQKAYYCP